jgi:poly(A) polymerase
LSNAEQAVLELAAGERGETGLPAEPAAKAALYRLGPKDYRASVLIAWARAGAAPDDPQWRLALSLPDRWQAPAFPLRGPDIIALGDVKGPEIGDMLRRLEAEWIASAFTLDREALLAKARQLVQG